MTASGRYRRLLAAFPPEARAGRGEEMIGTVLDLAEARGRTRPRARDMLDVAATGLRTRYRRSLDAHGHIGNASWFAAALALGVHAGFAVGMLRHWIDHGGSYYIGNLAFWASGLYVAQMALWLLAAVAFAAGLHRVAAAGAVLAASGSVWLLWAGMSGDLLIGKPPFYVPLLSATAAAAVVTAYGLGVRRRPRRLWLPAVAVLGAVFALLEDGVSATSPRAGLFEPGGLVYDPWANQIHTGLWWVLTGFVVLGLAAMWLYPSVSLGAAALTVPFVLLSTSVTFVPGYRNSVSVDLVALLAFVVLPVAAIVGTRRLAR